MIIKKKKQKLRKLLEDIYELDVKSDKRKVIYYLGLGCIDALPYLGQIQGQDLNFLYTLSFSLS